MQKVLSATLSAAPGITGSSPKNLGAWHNIMYGLQCHKEAGELTKNLLLGLLDELIDLFKLEHLVVVGDAACNHVSSG